MGDEEKTDLEKYIHEHSNEERAQKQMGVLEQMDVEKWRFLKGILTLDIRNMRPNGSEICPQALSSALKSALWRIFENATNLPTEIVHEYINRIFFLMCHFSSYSLCDKCNCDSCNDKSGIRAYVKALAENGWAHNRQNKFHFEIKDFISCEQTDKKPVRDILSMGFDMMMRNYGMNFNLLLFEAIMRHYENDAAWLKFENPEESDSLKIVLKMCYFIFLYNSTNPVKIPEQKAIYFANWERVIPEEIPTDNKSWEQILPLFNITLEKFYEFFSGNERVFAASFGKMSVHEQGKEKARMEEIKKRRREETERKKLEEQEKEEKEKRRKELVEKGLEYVKSTFPFTNNVPGHVIIACVNVHIRPDLVDSEEVWDPLKTGFLSDLKRRVHGWVTDNSDTLAGLASVSIKSNKIQGDEPIPLDDDDDDNEKALSCYACVNAHGMLQSPLLIDETHREQTEKIDEHFRNFCPHFCFMCSCFAASESQLQTHLDSDDLCGKQDWAKMKNAECDGCGEKGHMVNTCYRTLNEEPQSDAQRMHRGQAVQFVKDHPEYRVTTGEAVNGTKRDREGNYVRSQKPLASEGKLVNWKFVKNTNFNVVFTVRIGGDWTIPHEGKMYNIVYHFKDSFKAVAGNNHWKRFKKSEYGKTWSLC